MFQLANVWLMSFHCSLYICMPIECNQNKTRSKSIMLYQIPSKQIYPISIRNRLTITSGCLFTTGSVSLSLYSKLGHQSTTEKYVIDLESKRDDADFARHLSLAALPRPLLGKTLLYHLYPQSFSAKAAFAIANAITHPSTRFETTETR